MRSTPTRRLALATVAAAAALLLGGCASIVDGNSQSLSVKTLDKSEREFVGARCSLTNDKGVWYLVAPGSVTVHRSYADLVVECQAPEQEPGSTRANSTTKGMAFGNVLLGGVIGAGVDVATGAAYDYPQLITVTMGRQVDLAASKAQRPEDAASGTTATTAAPPPLVQRTFVVEASAGAEHVLHAHASWNGNCTQRPAPVITVIAPPANGTISVRREPIVITDSTSSKCLGMTFDGSRVYYKPNDGFRGTEQVAYRYDTGLTSGEVHVTVNVR